MRAIGIAFRSSGRTGSGTRDEHRHHAPGLIVNRRQSLRSRRRVFVARHLEIEVVVGLSGRLVVDFEFRDLFVLLRIVVEVLQLVRADIAVFFLSVSTANTTTYVAGGTPSPIP